MSLAAEAFGLDMDALHKQVEESMSDFVLTEEDEELSDYEKLRLRNIERNRRMLALCCSESKNKLDEMFKKPVQEAPPLKKRRSTVVKTPRVPTEIRRSRRIQNMPPRKLIKIKMFGQTDSSCYLDDVEFLEEEYVEEEWDPDTDFKGWKSCNYKRTKAIETPKRQRRSNGRVGRVPVDKRTPEEITQEDIANIAVRGKKKIFCRIRGVRLGTTCHQCRQKTLDTKTICRSGSCRGVRGQFCGVCLSNRYGESAKSALYDPVWACPVCRKICNCSFCLFVKGVSPTGILYPYVVSQGFKSVHHYMEHQKKLKNKERNPADDLAIMDELLIKVKNEKKNSKRKQRDEEDESDKDDLEEDCDVIKKKKK